MDYTTKEIYTDWAEGSTEPVTQPVIDEANDAVGAFLTVAVYAADDAGMPSDPDVLARVRRAANLQVVSILRNRKASETGGQTPANLSSASIGGVSYTYKADAVADPLKLPSDGSLCVQARKVLLTTYGLRWIVGTYG